MGSNYRSIDESGNDIFNIGGELKFLAGGSLSGAGFSFKGTSHLTLTRTRLPTAV